VREDNLPAAVRRWVWKWGLSAGGSRSTPTREWTYDHKGSGIDTEGEGEK